ncbi:cobyrinic acid A,C-diamide synthase [Sulfolobus acidocaldarius SUSAZ]|nr:cobyrinic acid A,C-diamide synthase [Sulfolobus acidocaldarius SUSAZ]
MRFPRIIISSDRSNSGKTLVTAGLIKVLSNRYKVRGYKVGPDFIDPMYHKIASGHPVINLDLWLMGESGVYSSLTKYGKHFDVGIIEGVMGLYDGLYEDYSTYKLSELTHTPLILVINCSNLSSTVGAIVKGLKEYRNANVRGVIFNYIASEKHLDYCKKSIPENVEVLGYLPIDKSLSIPSRHLGLYTTEDFKNAKDVINATANLIEMNVDVDKIVEIAEEANELQDSNEIEERNIVGKAYVAYDSAFSFYYNENIDILKKRYDVEFFSPLNNDAPADQPSFIYIGGGYPELHLEELENSTRTKDWIKRNVEKGVKLLAECGGFMFLSNEIINEKSYRMIGLYDIQIKAKDKLTIGYTELETEKDNLLSINGESIRGHEFHVSKAISVGDVNFAFKNKHGKGIWNGKDGVYVENSLGSYSHFHFSRTRRLLSF